MPIDRLFKEGKIKPEDLGRLDRAFTFSFKSLHLVDRNDPSATSSRAKSSTIDKAGIHDPQEIAARAARERAARRRGG